MKLSVGILAALTVLLLPQSGLAQRQRAPGAMFERMDQNRDGFLTQDELPQQRQRSFDLMLQRGDTNQDGKLTKEEFTASLGDGAGRPQRGGRSQGRPGMAPGGPGARAERMFEQLDSNGDGRVTKDEVPDRMEQFLERFDRDGDGMVTEDEVSDQPFQGSAPALGQPLPELTVYDAQGREFNLSSLKGNYSVLVFGCLT